MSTNTFDYQFLFKLGQKQVAIIDLVPAALLKKLKQKFVAVEDLGIVIRETIRYLFLSSNSPEPLFFVGDQLMDEVWHCFVLETEFYRALCDKLSRGTFVDHSGVTYEEYCEELPTHSAHEEQFSWLSSYIHNFGPIEARAYEHLSQAKMLAENLNFSLNQLNVLGKNLIEQAQLVSESELELKETFLLETMSNAGLIDSDHYTLEQYLLRAIKIGLNTELLPNGLLSNDYLYEIYSASTALGFTLAQHLLATERLSTSKIWQSQNGELWDNILDGKLLVGLATTYLGTGSSNRISVEESPDGYKVSGTIPWATGGEIFKKLILAFETDKILAFAIIPFPKITNDVLDSSAQNLTLTTMNGTATVSLKFTNYFCSKADIIQSRLLTDAPLNTGNVYRMPELGIANGLYKYCLKAIETTSNTLLADIKNALIQLGTQLKELNDIRKNEEQIKIDTLFKKDSLIKNLSQLMFLIDGGKCFSPTSNAPRLLLESQLSNVAYQPVDLLKLKIKSLCNQ